MKSILDLLKPDLEVTIRKRTETIKNWEEKIKLYETSLTDCKCKSFKYRGWCNHQGFLLWKINQLRLNSAIPDAKKSFLSDVSKLNGNYDKLAEKYGDKFISELVDRNEIALTNYQVVILK